MTNLSLSGVVEGVSTLRGVFITLMPDCLLFDSWIREGSTWVAEDVAAYFGDLVRANREGLRSLGSWSADMQVTIESADSLVVLRELDGGFVASFVFDRTTPLGMVRLSMKQMLDRLTVVLPKVELEQRPRGVRVVEYVQRYAPDGHAALMRMSLQSGVTLAELDDAGALSDQQVERLESAARNILGVDALAY